MQGKGKLEVSIYPDATRAFTMQFEHPMAWAEHKLAYDPKSTEDAAKLVESFISAQLK